MYWPMCARREIVFGRPPGSRISFSQRICVHGSDDKRPAPGHRVSGDEEGDLLVLFRDIFSTSRIGVAPRPGEKISAIFFYKN